jgi:hypothetical protein
MRCSWCRSRMRRSWPQARRADRASRTCWLRHHLYAGVGEVSFESPSMVQRKQPVSSTPRQQHWLREHPQSIDGIERDRRFQRLGDSQRVLPSRRTVGERSEDRSRSRTSRRRDAYPLRNTRWPGLDAKKRSSANPTADDRRISATILSKPFGASCAERSQAEPAPRVVADESHVALVERFQEVRDALGCRPSRQIGCGRGIGVRAERPGRNDASHAAEASHNVVPQGPGDPHSVNEDEGRTVTGDAVADCRSVQVDGLFGRGHPPRLPQPRTTRPAGRDSSTLPAP